MATFALVHGAWHGAWCWERLTPELESLGHRTITMDLPCDDGSATFDDYAAVVCQAIADIPGDELIVVGHSLAGQTIPLVAAQRPVRRLVYLCALPAVPGLPLAEEMAQDKEMLSPGYPAGLSKSDSEGRKTWVNEAIAGRHLFGDCDRETASAAFARLRPQASQPYRVPCSLGALPDVVSTYILCTEDGMVNAQWSRRIARERLRADLIEMPGGHSPFYSRPQDLAAVLDGLAA
jgi:pimeloyl-ACP methyl ester carboxylesterase